MAGLYDEPVGALDPKSMMLMHMGLGLMRGPSTTPISFGQSLGQAGMQGLQAYQQAHQAQQQEAFRALQAKKMEEEMALRRAEAERRAAMPVGHGPGTQLFRPGENEPFYTVPFKPEPAPEPRPPMTRKVRMGDQEVTQEYVNGQWQEVGRGPAFARQVPNVVVAGGGSAKTAPAPKAPAGFRWKQGAEGEELEPIPGGPKDTAPKDAKRLEGALSRADLVVEKVRDAKQKVGFSTTGLTGTVLGKIPGTDAYNLDRLIDTVKANIGFQELQAMREASPTGGALGQVAVQELNMLQSVLSSLDKGQSQEQLVKALDAVEKHFTNWKAAVTQAQGQGQPTPDPAAPTPAPAPSPTPQSFPTPPQDAIRRLKMNPKERDQFDAIFGPGAAAKVLGK